MLVYSTNNMVQLIEKAGRVCYRSEDKITDNSAEKFVAGIIKSGHESVIEHSNLVFAFNKEKHVSCDIADIFALNNLITYIPTETNNFFLQGNLRKFKDLVRNYYDNYYLDDLGSIDTIEEIIQSFYELPVCLFNDFIKQGIMYEELFKSSDAFEKFEVIEDGVVNILNVDTTHGFNSIVSGLSSSDIEKLLTATVRVKMTRSSSHQDVRHRLTAYSQESQRYVDLSDKFDYILPEEINPDHEFVIPWNDVMYNVQGGTFRITFEQFMNLSNAMYKSIREAGFKPEVAREVLPNACTTTLVITKTLEQWRHFFKLRCDSHAQLPIRTRACTILKNLQSYGYFPDLEIDWKNMTAKGIK